MPAPPPNQTTPEPALPPPLSRQVENHSPDKDGLLYENVTIETPDGETLACWFVKSASDTTVS